MSAEPAEGGAPSVPDWDLPMALIYKPHTSLILKCTHRQEWSASIIHQKAERLELLTFLGAGEGRPDFKDVRVSISFFPECTCEEDHSPPGFVEWAFPCSDPKAVPRLLEGGGPAGVGERLALEGRVSAQ